MQAVTDLKAALMHNPLLSKYLSYASVELLQISQTGGGHAKARMSRTERPAIHYTETHRIDSRHSRL
jgi:hypothetical protein